MEILTDLQSEISTYYSSLISVLPKIALGIVLSTVLFILLSYARKQIFKMILKRAEDPLFVNFLERIVGFFNTIITILFFLYVIGLEGIAGTILAAAGVTAFVIGFAFKDIGENFLAGIILAFKRPFKIGDTIESNKVVGTILALNIRDTHIKTSDGKDVFIPNAQIIKNPLFNYTTDGYVRKGFTIAVENGTEVEKARKAIIDSLSTVKGIISDYKKPLAFATEFNSSTIQLEVQFWVNTFDKSVSEKEVINQALVKVYGGLAKAGIVLS